MMQPPMIPPGPATLCEGGRPDFTPAREVDVKEAVFAAARAVLVEHGATGIVDRHIINGRWEFLALKRHFKKKFSRMIFHPQETLGPIHFNLSDKPRGALRAFICHVTIFAERDCGKIISPIQAVTVSLEPVEPDTYRRDKIPNPKKRRRLNKRFYRLHDAPIRVLGRALAARLALFQSNPCTPRGWEWGPIWHVFWPHYGNNCKPVP